MAVKFNLSDLSNAQRTAGTLRKSTTPYTYPLLSATPYARQDALDTADAAHKQSVLNQEKSQFDQQLNQNASQYNTSLAQSAKQFSESQAMQQQVANEQAKQAETASYIQGAQTLGTVAAMTKDAWLPAAKEALGLAAPKVASAAAPVAADAAGTALAGQATQAGTELAGAGANTVAQGATGSAVGDTLGVTTGEVVGSLGKTAASVVGNAALYYALGKAAQAAGGAMHENNQSYPLAQFGHNLQDAVSLPGYTETGLNEGYSTVERDGRTFGTYDSDGRGTAANIIEGVLPVESGSLGRAARESIDAAARLNTGDMLDAAGQIMSPFTSVAEKAFGYEPGESQAINTLANPIASVYNSIQDTNTSTVDTVAAVFTGGLSNLFCFAAGTPVEMAAGDIFHIEDIDLDNIVAEGGQVLAVGRAWTENLYEYKGIRVEGHHAVFDQGTWKRVADCACAAPVPGKYVVYPLVCDKHLIISRDIVFADLAETPLGWDITDAERLTWLNNQTKRNEYLRRSYGN